MLFPEILERPNSGIIDDVQPPSRYGLFCCCGIFAFRFSLLNGTRLWGDVDIR